MEDQRERARASQKKSVVTVKSADQTATVFDGYASEKWQQFEAKILDIIESKEGGSMIVFEKTPFYGEKGGQVGDTGTIKVGDQIFVVLDTTIDANGIYLHHIKEAIDSGLVGETASLSIDVKRRRAIQRHHSATHLLHWALRKEVGDHVHQAGFLCYTRSIAF